MKRHTRLPTSPSAHKRCLERKCRTAWCRRHKEPALPGPFGMSRPLPQGEAEGGNPSDTGAIRRLFSARSCSFFQTRECHPFDKILLREKEQHQDRQRRGNGTRHQLVPLDRVPVAKNGQPEL